MRKNRKFYKYFALLLTVVLPLTLVTPTQADFQPFIVGGNTVSTWSQYPYQVGLVLKTGANFDDGAFAEQFCGGVAVTSNWILTAAHCVTTVNQSNGTFAVVDATTIGIVGSKLRLSTYRGEDVISVSQIIIHPSASLFDQGEGAAPNRYLLSNNDIALLEIASLPTGVVVATSLGDLSEEVAGTASTVTGWGRNNNVDPATFPDDLLFGAVSITSNSDCATTYGAIFIPGTQICAIGGVTSARVNVCSGDSGGPLVSNSLVSLLGLTSYGRIPCGSESPGVFTRVSAFLGWIYPLIDTTNVADRSVLSVSAASVVADDSSTSIITVQLKDSASNNFNSGGASVAMASDLGTISTVTDNSNGTYSATLRSSSTGTATVTASVNGTAISGTTSVTFTSPTPSPTPPPSSSSGGGGGSAPAAAAVVVAPVVSTLQPGARVTGTKWNVVTGTDGITRARVSVGTKFRGKNAVFFKRLKNGRLIRVSTGRIGRAGRAKLQTRVKFREGQKIRVQVDGRFRSTITIRN
ncbi:MAG: trypsin-like serine protease [Candidatus Nanopelagicales bacterium]